MGLTGMDLDNCPDQVDVSVGNHHVRIKAAKHKVGQIKEGFEAGRDMILVTLVAEDEPEASPIFHHVFYIQPEDSDETKLRFRQDMKAFFMAFGADFSICEDPERFSELVGLEASANVTTETDSNTGEERLKVSKFFEL